ncbi:MAG: acyl carrier protein [Clostridia bacterium]|nr:acyl carrier protein [Clostridia bacterium]
MVFEKIKTILGDQFDVDGDSITSDTLIEEDLGADSLDLVDLIMTLESEFDLSVNDADVESIKTVGELVNFIELNS